MAADTKLGEPDYVAVEWDNGREGVAISVARLREHLAAQGLHVVTAADKAVLDAMAESRIDVNGCFIDSITEQAAGLAELSRRQENK